MDRRELLDRAAHSPEERLLLSRVWDKCEQCRTRNIPTATGFLSPAEQAAAQGFLVLLGARESGIFWGWVFCGCSAPATGVPAGLAGDA